MALARLFNRTRALIAIGFVAFAALAALAGHAIAQQSDGWQICNETSYVLEAATARPDGQAILVQGWTRLRPGECRLAVRAPLARGTHYLYARTSAAHRGGRGQWGGDARLCVDPNNTFSIENPPECAAMGLEERLFRRVQINKRDSWRTSFAEAEPYTLARARQAGLQRLLDDAGYDLYASQRSIDPRAIATAIAQFRANAHLAPNASEDQLIDALEVAARRRADQVGLTLCNRTHGHLWTAVARRRGEGWESRGWWGLNPGGCVRTIDEVLIQDLYYVFASLDTDQGPRLLAAGGEPFCSSPSRFAVLGREHCDQRFYDTTLFTPISAHQRQGLVVDFSDRDFLEPGQQPRQTQPLQNSGPDVVSTEMAPLHGLAPPTAPHGTGRLMSIGEIEAWVFDLDNTLYASSALYDAIGDRMTAHIARALGVSHADALVLRERYFHQYGATVVGLARHHAMDAHAFLADVHDVDYSVLEADEELGALIEALPGRKIVFTNGGGGHGQRALAQLAIAHHFELVFDIEATGLSPKPQREAYERLIAVCALDPSRTMLIEDSLRNLEPAHALGFTTALVGPEAPSPHPACVDYWAPDLKRFLTDLALGIVRR